MKNFIIKSKLFASEKTLDEARARFIYQLNENGVVVMSPDFEIVPIPSEWVKASVASPKVYSEILFCDANKIEYIGTFNNFEQYVDRSGEIIEDVVAWMPAPLPYEE